MAPDALVLPGLTDLETWALERPQGGHVRVAILQKARSNKGYVRLDSSTIKTIELEYVPKGKRWRVLIGAMPVEDDVRNLGWQRLTDLMFKE